MRAIVSIILIFGFLTEVNAQKNDILIEANLQYNSGKFYEAVDIYKKQYPRAIDEDEKLFLIFRIGECYHRAGNFKLANFWYSKAVKANYSDNMLHYQYSLVLTELGKSSQASKQMDVFLANGGSIPDELWKTEESLIDHSTEFVNSKPVTSFSIEETEATYYALIIGNNNYQDDNLNDLDQPINDATKLYNSLTTQYTFDKENVIFLKDATRRDIIIAFDNLTRKLTIDDNLLIFYAGHGHWDSELEAGYWLPVDAERDVTVDWLRNSTVQGYIENIKAKHTLLVADACFGGGIFKTRAAFDDADRSINNLYKFDSRKAMTSGMLNEVPDRS
ncbi:MAG: caspase family protein, partial [Vicingaceae bacterium]